MHNIGKLFTTAIILLIAVGCKVSSDGGSGDEKTDLKISATAGVYGKISPSGTVKVSYGANQSFTITADPNYQVLDVIVDGVSEGALTSYTFKNVKTNHTIQASFKDTTYYTIIASAGYNGSISPSGSVTVAQGAIQTFTITADPNYQVLDVIVDGGSKGPLTNFTFTNVTKNHTIEANFDKEHQIITMGDSITAGFGDDLPGDDVSEDGKNSGGGFQPILNDLLTAYEKGFPHDVVNEGVGGDTSADGLALIPTVLSR